MNGRTRLACLGLWFACVGCDTYFVDRDVQVGLGGAFTNPTVIVPLSGRIDVSTLPEPGAPRNASVFLLSYSTLDQVPIETKFEKHGENPESEFWLEAESIEGMAPGRYALVVTDEVLDLNGQRVGREPAFHAAFENDRDAEPNLRETLLELRAVLVRDRRELALVAGAVVFSVAAQ